MELRFACVTMRSNTLASGDGDKITIRTGRQQRQKGTEIRDLQINQHGRLDNILMTCGKEGGTWNKEQQK